tara:strand:- start:1147 stop:2751 length:1605 start_codon:yes stop_codon:yes gene_type:complete
MKNSQEKNKEITEENQLNKSLKLIVKTSFIVLIGLIISKLLTYSYRIIIARYFGPEIYGLFFLALSIVPIFITLASFGFTDGLVRFISSLRAKNKINEIRYLFKKTAKFYFISGIISSIVLIALSDFISIYIFNEPNLSIFLKIMGFGVLVVMFLSMLLATIRAFEKIGWHSFIFNIFQNVVRIGLLIVLILMGFSSGANVVVWSYVIGSILTLLLAYLVCRYKINKIFGTYKKKNYSKISKKFFQYSWPITFYGIISIIFHSIDTLSLGYYKSSIEVGFYNAAVPIALLIGFIPELFMQLFFPLINREHSNKHFGLIKQLSKQINKWIFMIIFPVFILIFLFPGVALNLLFGSQYLIAQTALRFLLIGSFISALFIVSSNLISMLGKSKLIMFNISSAAILNLILNSILVPIPVLFSLDNSKGLIGASLATLLSIVFLNILFAIQTKKYLSFLPLKKKMITIILVSIIPISILFYLRSIITISVFSGIVIVFLFILLYTFLIFISHSLDKKDLMIIRAVIKKLFKSKREPKLS